MLDYESALDRMFPQSKKAHSVSTGNYRAHYIPYSQRLEDTSTEQLLRDELLIKIKTRRALGKAFIIGCAVVGIGTMIGIGAVVNNIPQSLTPENYYTMTHNVSPYYHCIPGTSGHSIGYSLGNPACKQ